MSTRKQQLSVAVNDQHKLARRVEAAAASLADKAQQAFLAVLPPILAAGESPPDMSAASHMAARWLVWRRERLRQAETRYASELRADQRLRELRDEAIQTLIANLRVVQAQLDLAVGKGRSASFAGFSTGLQNLDPFMLLHIAEDAIAELRQNDFGLAKAQTAQANLGEMVASIEEPKENLRRILEELPISLRETEKALEAKQTELGLQNLDTRRISAFLSGIYRLAGLDFHADRLRPKAATSAKDDDEPPLGGGSPGGSDPGPPPLIAANDQPTPATAEVG